MLTDIYPQFITIASLHLFAVMSPGPDFALILRQTFCHGRRSSIVTSIGIGVGILFHIIFCIVGLGMILSTSEYIFNIIRVFGGIYLVFIGYKSFVSKNSIHMNSTEKKIKLSTLSAFSTGLLTNILNPKATLFFLSLYTFIINEHPLMAIQIFYGIWMSVITTLWFCLLSFVLTNDLIFTRIEKFLHGIQNCTGIILVLIGLRLIIEN